MKSLNTNFVFLPFFRLDIKINIAIFKQTSFTTTMASIAYNPNYETIGQAFVQHFYNKFDVPDAQTRTVGLNDLYDAEHSFMTFEGNQVKGRQAILEKFGALPFRKIQHGITKTDSQPLPDGSILVTVIGQLKTDDDPVNSFNHCFILRPNSTGSFFISNEVFRLVLH